MHGTAMPKYIKETPKCKPDIGLRAQGYGQSLEAWVGSRSLRYSRGLTIVAISNKHISLIIILRLAVLTWVNRGIIHQG